MTGGLGATYPRRSDARDGFTVDITCPRHGTVVMFYADADMAKVRDDPTFLRSMQSHALAVHRASDKRERERHRKRRPDAPCRHSRFKAAAS